MTTEDIPAKPTWLTAPDAADYIGVHVNHLRAIAPERLPYYLVAGRNRRYKIEDVLEYIEKSKVTAQTVSA